jgi:hypothetical protein
MNMKTTKTLQNAALTLMLVFTASFTFSQSDNQTSGNLSSEKAEFANAGYWIDAVTVNAYDEKSDRQWLADKGYFIEPVIVTYSRTVQDYIDTHNGTIFYTQEKASENLEVSMLNDNQAR